jgi:hypothetical protein
MRSIVANILFVSILLTSQVFAQEAEEEEQPVPDSEPTQLHGMIDLNYYPYDTRDYSVFTINLAAYLPHGFNYFSFVNYTTGINSAKNQDLQDFYTEQNVSWALPDNLPFDILAQWVIASGVGNDVLRLGPGLIISSMPPLKKFLDHLGIFYVVHFFPGQIDSLSGFNWQIEHFYKFSIFPKQLQDRVFVYGFLDQNFGPGGMSTVHEHNLGVRVINRFHLVTEYRHNAYLPDTDGLGVGAEFKVGF